MKFLSYLVWFGGFVLSSWILLGCSGPSASSVTIETPSPTRVSAPAATPTHLSNAVRSPTPASSSTFAPPTDLSETELKYRLIEEFGSIFFCDRDLYPVAHEVSDQEIARRVAELRQQPEIYTVILKHLGLQDVTNLSAGQDRAIDAEHKRLNAIELQPGAQVYTFQLRTSEDGERGFATQGTISNNGVITTTQQEPTMTSCPICLDGSTLIDTPQGELAIEDLRKGMLIWTLSPSGGRESASILEIVRRPVPAGSSMVHLVLDDDRELFVSAMHPTITGEPIGNLDVGDLFDNARVRSSELVPLEDDATYDILPSGATGAYWANGILLGSTLHRGER